MNKSLLTAVVVALLLGVLITPAAAEENQRPEDSWEHYNVLVQRNMFLKSRVAPPTPSTRVTREDMPVVPVAPPRAERFIVLTGVIRQGREYIAFLEDTRTRETSRIRLGETIAGGRIAGIALDYIEYLEGDEALKIEIGKTLEGTARPAVSAAPSVRTEPAVGTSPTSSTVRITAPPAITTEDRATLLERLRQRRQMEIETQ